MLHSINLMNVVLPLLAYLYFKHVLTSRVLCSFEKLSMFKLLLQVNRR